MKRIKIYTDDKCDHCIDHGELLGTHGTASYVYKSERTNVTKVAPIKHTRPMGELHHEDIRR